MNYIVQFIKKPIQLSWYVTGFQQTAPNGSLKVTDLNIALQCFSECRVRPLVEKLSPCGLL